MTLLSQTLDLLHKHFPKNQEAAFDRAQPLVAQSENITFYIWKAKVVRGDLMVTAPNGDRRFVSNLRCPKMKEAVTLSVLRRLQSLKPANF